MTIAASTDRFAAWRRRVHPVLLTVVTAFIVLLVGAILIPAKDRTGTPRDLLTQVLLPSIVTLVVIVVGRSANISVLSIRLPFLQAAAWIVVPAVLLIAIVLAAARLSRSGFFLVDYVVRTSAFPVWLVEQIAGATTYPFVEEVMFRGVLQTELRKRIGSLAAIPITSVLFGFAHFDGSLDFLRIGLLCCAGLVFGIVRERTDSLGAPIAVHGLYNAALSGLEFVA